MKCQREYPTLFVIKLQVQPLHHSNAHILSLIVDVGADILDLAETMITSNGLQYEPVSQAHVSKL